MSERDAGDYAGYVAALKDPEPVKRWTWLSRDGWGLIVTVEAGIELTESEARARNDMMRQLQHGWLAPEASVPTAKAMEDLR